MKLVSPALLIEALSVRYPDSSTLFAPDVFADFVVEYAKDFGFDLPIVDVLRAQGLSPTGRKPSQPEYQHLRPSAAPIWPCVPDKTPRQHPLVECSETQPGPPRPFFDTTTRPMRTEHVSVDDKGNVTYSGITRAPRKACRPFPHDFAQGVCIYCGVVKLS